MLFDFISFRGSHTGALIFESFDAAIGVLRERVLAIAGDNASNNDTFFGGAECHEYPPKTPKYPNGYPN